MSAQENLDLRAFNPRPRTAKKIVLVVEDDAAFRRDLCLAIVDSGALAVGAANGRDAIDWLNRGVLLPSAIVLDLVMDEMDGEGFCAWQRQSPRFSSVPVVLISARQDVAVVAKRLGVHAHLGKPFLPEVLVSELLEIF